MKNRTPRMVTAFAVQEAIEKGEVLRKLVEAQTLNNKGRRTNISISIDMYEVSTIIDALRDYVTCRIANLIDPHPAALSLKDFNGVNLAKLGKINELKEILLARDNWVAHLNPRFIGPVKPQMLYSKKIVNILETLDMLINTEYIGREKTR